MFIRRRSALAAAAVLTALSVHAEDLGTIQVESSTITDRFEDKRTEPSSVAVVSGREVDRSHAESIQQVLRAIPGITTELQGGDSLKIHIRGVENQAFMGENPGVAVVIDGVPVFERTGKVNIDLDNIESIRVVKGGASYLFGNDALGGAVIITTKRGAEYAGYAVGAEAGSHGWRKGLVRAGTAGEDYNAHVQVSTRQSDGYHDDSDYRADYVDGKLQYYLDDVSDVTVGFELADRDKDSHGAVRGVSAAKEDPRSTNPLYNDYARQFDIGLQKYFVTYARDFGPSNLTVNAYQFSDDTDFISSPSDADPAQYQNANDYFQVQRGVKSEWRSGGESLAWMAGVDLRANRYENETHALIDHRIGRSVFNAGDLKEDNSTDEQVAAVYGELKYRVSTPLTLTANARYDIIDLDYADDLTPADSGEEGFRVASGRLGVNYAVSDSLDWFGNVSTGFRTPTVEQLFVGRYSPYGEVLPNNDLDPEFAVNYEIGLRARTEWLGMPLEADATVFLIDREDYINANTGLYVGGPDARYENVGSARHQGLELSLAGRPAASFWWDLAYTYLDAYYTDYDRFNLTAAPLPDGSCSVGSPVGAGWSTWCVDPRDLEGNQLPRVPHHHLNVAFNWRAAPRWLVTAEVDSTSRYWADEANLLRMDGRTLVGLLITHEREIAGGDWEFFLRVDNLFDEEFFTTARGYDDMNEDGYYDAEDLSISVDPGRVWTAGLTARF